MKAIIFGSNGQDGFYLAQLLKQKNIEFISISRNGDNFKTDISFFSEVANLIKEQQPQYIFHFAANSTTRHDALFENHATIATGTLNILEAVKIHSPNTKVFISGSGLQFKNEARPIKEKDIFEARDAYSVSRIQSVYAARYFRSLGVKAYVGYFFNHDSPLRSERHMTKKIAEAAKRISGGSNEILEVGDVSVIKEYGYAGDIIEGVWTLVNQENVLEANISTGIGYSIKDWIEECFKISGKDWQQHVSLINGFTAEYKQLISDASLIYSLGWKPRVDFKQLAKMMMK